MNNPLTPNATTLLATIVSKITDGTLIPGNPKTYLGYKEVHDLMGKGMAGPRWDVSLKNLGLVELAEWTKALDVPKVTGLIVNQHNHTPGKGYFKQFDMTEDDLEWWHKQAKDSIIYDWSPYISEIKTPSRQDLALEEKFINEGKLQTVNLQVRQRCQALKKRAKTYYRSQDGKLRCEACNWHNKKIEAFKGDIVEMHHIEAVESSDDSGTTWTLKSAILNLIPLCPTCHRLIHAYTISGSISRVKIPELLRTVNHYD